MRTRDQLRRAALTTEPLPEETVAALYAESNDGNLLALCESHERLRAELEGAEKLLAERRVDVMEGQTKAEAREAALSILANMGDWEGEAAEAAQRAQDDRAWNAVMQEHLTDAIYAVLKLRLDSWRKEIRKSLSAHRNHYEATVDCTLEKLLGES